MRKIRPLDGLIEALGATGADVHRMVLWQGLRLGLAGTLLGLAADSWPHARSRVTYMALANMILARSPLPHLCF
jgi:hypothetical protein